VNGDRQLHFDELEARLSEPLSERMLELAELQASMSVLDVASGRGEPALRLAARVTRVVGIDVSESSLEVARQRALDARLRNVDFRCANVEAFETDERFEVVTCRWGLMYMTEPRRALAAIHQVLKPDGLLVLALWGEPERISWATVPRRVTSRFAVLAPTAASRYGTLAKLEPDLLATGFRVEHEEEHEVGVVQGERGADIVEWVRVVLSRLADVVPEPQRAQWAAELAREAEAHRRGAVIQLGGWTRLVVARRV
jgi:SAM-dependent methyltransferase